MSSQSTTETSQSYETMGNSWENDVIVVTGNLSSGKSSITDILRKLGAYVVSADVLARKAVESGSPGYQQIISEFGPSIATPSGELDRRALGAIVFNDETKRKKLEAITHPIVAELAAQAFQNSAATQASLKVYECPLFYEAGLNTKPFHKIIVAKASRDTSLQRALTRDNLTRAELAARYDSQIPNAEKCSRADFVIDTESSREEMENLVQSVFMTLTQKQK